MMYPYITLPDETEIVHSQIVTESGKQKVIVNFERPTETGFDSARCETPGNTWISVVGYSSEEIRRFEEFLQDNVENIMEKAKAKQKSYCDSNIKEEKINGVTYTIPKSEAYQHGIVAGNISTIIHYGLSKGSLVFTGNLDYRYHPAVNDDYVVPDVLVVHDRKNLRDTYYCGIPKFVVEIVSPATVLHDRKDKLKIYQEADVQEYWIISSMERSVEIYYLVAGRYVLQDCYILQDDSEEDYYNADQVITLREFPNISLTLAEIFENRD